MTPNRSKTHNTDKIPKRELALRLKATKINDLLRKKLGRRQTKRIDLPYTVKVWLRDNINT